jgi:hypothetical protein
MTQFFVEMFSDDFPLFDFIFIVNVAIIVIVLFLIFILLPLFGELYSYFYKKYLRKKGLNLREIDLKVNNLEYLFSFKLMKSRYIETLTPRSKLIFDYLFDIFISLIFYIPILFVLSGIIGNPYYEYKLRSEGITTIAEFTKIEEYQTNENGDTKFEHTYNFLLPNGTKVENVQDLDYKLCDDLLMYEFYENSRFKSEIVYLENSPKINIIKKTLATDYYSIITNIILIIFCNISNWAILSSTKVFLKEIKIINKRNG